MFAYFLRVVEIYFRTAENLIGVLRGYGVRIAQELTIAFYFMLWK